MSKIVIYYFTGTGNSRYIAESLQKNLNSFGHETFISSIEDKNPNSFHSQAEYVGIVAPVYGFGIPERMVDFLNRIPRSKSQKSFVFISYSCDEEFKIGSKTFTVPSHGGEGISIFQTMFLLWLKGYRTVSAHPVPMPTNWTLVVDSKSDEKLQKIYTDAEKVIKEYSAGIFEGKKTLRLITYVISPVLLPIYLAFYLLGRHVLGKCFTVNEKCTSCKICYNSCPAKVIKWKNNRPYWGWNCQQCCRCINICPHNAVEISGFALYPALVLTLFLGEFTRLIPANLLQWTGGLKPVFGFIIPALAAFPVMWAIHYAVMNPVFGKFLPKLYLTKKRKRYNALLK